MRTWWHSQSPVREAFIFPVILWQMMGKISVLSGMYLDLVVLDLAVVYPCCDLVSVE